jgi:hypothetical protein
MQNATWVIDFRRRAPAAATRVGLVADPMQALELVRRRRRSSRKMFAVTRALLAEARAVLDAKATAGGAIVGRAMQMRSDAARTGVPGSY